MHIEGFPDLSGSMVATDYLYGRRSAGAGGSRDFRFSSANVVSFVNLVLAANKLPYATAVGTLALTDFTPFARTLLDDATYVVARTTLGFVTATAPLDFGSISAGNQADLTISVAGAAVGDAVILGPPAAPAAGLVFNVFVSAADTVKVRASNISGSPVDQASMTFRVTVLKSV